MSSPIRLLPCRITDHALAVLALSGAWSAEGIESRWRAAWPQVRIWRELLDALLEAIPAGTAARMSTNELAEWMQAHRGLHPIPARELPDRYRAPFVLARPQRPLSWQPSAAPAPAPKLEFRPIVLNLPELASCLRLSEGELDWLRARYRGHAHYRLRLVPRSDGRMRLLEIPKARLKQVQRKILRELLPADACSAHAHGFVPGRSALTHARQHCGRGSLLQLDLRDWFASIALPRVRSLFLDLGYPPDVAEALAQLCTVRLDVVSLAQLPAPLRMRMRDRRLPQGAPTSPALANLCALALDRRLAAYAAAAGWRYSRYADDLVFSSDAPSGADMRRALPTIERILRDEGFAPNPAKTRIQSQGQRQQVTGIVTNTSPSLAREDYDRLKAEVHAWCQGRGRMDAGETRAQALLRLRGRLGWLRQLHPTRAEKLLIRLRDVGLA